MCKKSSEKAANVEKMCKNSSENAANVEKCEKKTPQNFRSGVFYDAVKAPIWMCCV